jgi:hypothetical protein
MTIELCILERTDHVNPRWDEADSYCRCNVAVGFDLGLYIIGALVIWRFIVMVKDHPPSGVITSESPTGIFGRLMPTVSPPCASVGCAGRCAWVREY